MRQPPAAAAGRTAAGAVAIALASCGAAGPAAPASTSTSRSPTPTPATAAVAPTPTPLLLGPITPTPVPTLAGVHYIVPPGWTVSSTSAPAAARLSTGSGLSMELRLADGAAGVVTAATGRPIVVDGSTGYEAGGSTQQGFRDRIDVGHAGHVYEVVCTSPDPGDQETTVDICRGFVDGMRWTS